MNFAIWLASFQYDDTLANQLGVSSQQLLDWRGFIRDYKRAQDRYVSNQELVQAYYHTFPDKRPISELTIEQFKALP